MPTTNRHPCSSEEKNGGTKMDKGIPWSSEEKNGGTKMDKGIWVTICGRQNLHHGAIAP